MKKGSTIIISGPSGSGKGTVVKLLNKEKFSLSISATTRKPREGEVNGREYFFLDRDEFVELRENDGFLEHVEFCGNMYGTPVSYVNEQMELGKNVVLEIEVYGALQIKEMYPDCILIFLVPPSYDVLKERLVNRGTEDEEAIERRLYRTTEELEMSKKYDYIVVNDKIEDSVYAVEAICEAEYHKAKRNMDVIKNFRGEKNA